MLQDLFDVFQSLVQRLMEVLPRSPFRSIIEAERSIPWLSWLNWFFPVQQILIILAAWLAAIAVFYIWSVAARWVKLIGD